MQSAGSGRYGSVAARAGERHEVAAVGDDDAPGCSSVTANATGARHAQRRRGSARSPRRRRPARRTRRRPPDSGRRAPASKIHNWYWRRAGVVRHEARCSVQVARLPRAVPDDFARHAGCGRDSCAQAQRSSLAPRSQQVLAAALARRPAAARCRDADAAARTAASRGHQPATASTQAGAAAYQPRRANGRRRAVARAAAVRSTMRDSATRRRRTGSSRWRRRRRQRLAAPARRRGRRSAVDAPSGRRLLQLSPGFRCFIHCRTWIRPRRICVFTVPSGMPVAVAISECVRPSSRPMRSTLRCSGRSRATTAAARSASTRISPSLPGSAKRTSSSASSPVHHRIHAAATDAVDQAAPRDRRDEHLLRALRRSRSAPRCARRRRRSPAPRPPRRHASASCAARWPTPGRRTRRCTGGPPAESPRATRSRMDSVIACSLYSPAAEPGFKSWIRFVRIGV